MRARIERALSGFGADIGTPERAPPVLSTWFEICFDANTDGHWLAVPAIARGTRGRLLRATSVPCRAPYPKEPNVLGEAGVDSKRRMRRLILSPRSLKLCGL